MDARLNGRKVSKWLKDKMDTKGMTYARIASETELDATTISTIVRHERDIRMSTFAQLCAALGTDMCTAINEMVAVK